VYVLRLTDTLGLGRLLALERVHREFLGDLPCYQTIRHSHLSKHGYMFEGIYATDYEPMARPIPWSWDTDDVYAATVIAKQVFHDSTLSVSVNLLMNPPQDARLNSMSIH
jgi:hypothetical protein